jgi:hypothetical protein
VPHTRRVNPLNTWISLIALAVTITFWIVTTSTNAGAITERVSSLEKQQARFELAQHAQDQKLDKHTESLSRIEQKTDDILANIRKSR